MGLVARPGSIESGDVPRYFFVKRKPRDSRVVPKSLSDAHLLAEFESLDFIGLFNIFDVLQRKFIVVLSNK